MVCSESVEELAAVMRSPIKTLIIIFYSIVCACSDSIRSISRLALANSTACDSAERKDLDAEEKQVSGKILKQAADMCGVDMEV